MKKNDAIAFVGHQVHVCRFREAGTLLRWLGGDLRGKRVLDVAGGDGYWAGQARKRGAHAVSIDLARSKMLFGKTLRHAPGLVECDALALPFEDGSFDAVMSVCAIEHFDDGARSLDEMARVLAPGGQLVMSADVLSRSARWPELRAAHCTKYHVQHTYTHEPRQAAHRARHRPRGLFVPVPQCADGAALPDAVGLWRQDGTQRRGTAGLAGCAL